MPIFRHFLKMTGFPRNVITAFLSCFFYQHCRYLCFVHWKWNLIRNVILIHFRRLVVSLFVISLNVKLRLPYKLRAWTYEFFSSYSFSFDVIFLRIRSCCFFHFLFFMYLLLLTVLYWVLLTFWLSCLLLEDIRFYKLTFGHAW